jgi:transporter family-2 protein
MERCWWRRPPSRPQDRGCAALTLLVAGQFVMALALDHFGAMGLTPRPVNWPKALGLVLIAAGVLLVRR